METSVTNYVRIDDMSLVSLLWYFSPTVLLNNTSLRASLLNISVRLKQQCSYDQIHELNLNLNF